VCRYFAKATFRSAQADASACVGVIAGVQRGVNSIHTSAAAKSTTVI
jgi:hypothetical protein